MSRGFRERTLERKYFYCTELFAFKLFVAIRKSGRELPQRAVRAIDRARLDQKCCLLPCAAEFRGEDCRVKLYLLH